MKDKYKNLILLFGTCFLIILIDRILLWHVGLPPWEWDKYLLYKHRSNYIGNWGEEFNNKKIIINEYGFHDHSFPLKKKNGELRILNLGDSITMGHGVTRNETYSKFLEDLLKTDLKKYSIVEAINTGVQGYSTFQEYEMLKRCLKFQPDIVTVGFCLNDITEPFAVDKDLGGTGLDYHRVTQAQNHFTAYLLNETGFGRLIQEIRIRMLDAKQVKIEELYDVKKFLQNPDDIIYKKENKFTFSYLNKIFDLCSSRNIKVILLIFPYTFQFNHPQMKWLQNELIEEAKQRNISYIDYTKVFENLIAGKDVLINTYFLDEDHFTPAGHFVVANTLASSLLLQDAKN